MWQSQTCAASRHMCIWPRLIWPHMCFLLDVKDISMETAECSARRKTALRRAACPSPPLWGQKANPTVLLWRAREKPPSSSLTPVLITPIPLNTQPSSLGATHRQKSCSKCGCWWGRVGWEPLGSQGWEGSGHRHSNWPLPVQPYSLHLPTNPSPKCQV